MVDYIHPLLLSSDQMKQSLTLSRYRFLHPRAITLEMERTSIRQFLLSPGTLSSPINNKPLLIMTFLGMGM
jgi:hypothetical protein